MVVHDVRPWNAIKGSTVSHTTFPDKPLSKVTKLSSLTNLSHLHWTPLTKSSRTKSGQVGPSIGLYNSYSTNWKIWGEPSAWGCCFGRLACECDFYLQLLWSNPLLAIKRCGWQPLVERSMIKHLRRVFLLCVHMQSEMKKRQPEFERQHQKAIHEVLIPSCTTLKLSFQARILGVFELGASNRASALFQETIECSITISVSHYTAVKSELNIHSISIK